MESGKLDSEIHHPFLGIIKPYVSMERHVLEKIIADENNLINDYVPTINKYLPETTIKFLH